MSPIAFSTLFAETMTQHVSSGNPQSAQQRDNNINYNNNTIESTNSDIFTGNSKTCSLTDINISNLAVGGRDKNKHNAIDTVQLLLQTLAMFNVTNLNCSYIYADNVESGITDNMCDITPISWMRNNSSSLVKLNLQGINMKGNSYSHEPNTSLSGLGQHHNRLTTLCLSRCNINCSLMTCLCDVLAGGQLKYLDLQHNPICYDGASVLSELISSTSSLININMAYCRLAYNHSICSYNSSGMTSLAQSIGQHVNLTVLDMRYNNVNNNDIPTIVSHIVTCKQLKTVANSTCSLNHGNFTICAELNISKSIEEVCIYGYKFTDECIRLIGNGIPNNPGMKHVTIVSNKCLVELMRALQCLPRLNAFKYRSGQDTCETELVSISQSLNDITSLQTLQLDLTMWLPTDAVILALVDCITSHKTLATVVLKGCFISDDKRKNMIAEAAQSNPSMQLVTTKKYLIKQTLYQRSWMVEY